MVFEHLEVVADEMRRAGLDCLALQKGLLDGAWLLIHALGRLGYLGVKILLGRVPKLLL